MGRKSGSRDSYKRSGNYRGRQPGAKDLHQRDGFGSWKWQNEKRLQGFSQKQLRLRYLYEVVEMMWVKRLNFKIPEIIWMEWLPSEAGLRLAILGCKTKGAYYRKKDALRKFMGFNCHCPLTAKELAWISQHNLKVRLWEKSIWDEIATLEKATEKNNGG